MSGTDRPADEVPPTTTAPTDATDPADPGSRRRGPARAHADPLLERDGCGDGGLAGARVRPQRGARRRPRLGADQLDLHGGQHRAQHHLHPARRRRPQRGVRPAAGAGDEGRAGALPGVHRPAADARRADPARRSPWSRRSRRRWSSSCTAAGSTPEDAHVATLFAFWCLPQIFFYGLYTMLGQVLNGPEQLRADDVGAGRSTTWSPSRPAWRSSPLFSDRRHESTPSSLSTGAIVLLGAGHHARRRAAGRGPGAGAASRRVRLPAAIRLPRRRPRPGRRPREVDAAVRAGQPARLRRDRQPGAAGRRGRHQRAGLRRRLHRLRERLPDLHPAALDHHRLDRHRAAATAEPGGRRRRPGTRSARRLSEAWRLTGVGVVLAAAALVALGPRPDRDPVLRHLGPRVRSYIGLVAAAFALGLPAFSAQYVALRGFYAFEDTRTPFLLQVAIAGTNVLLALAAYAVLPLRWRMVGVALAYSVTYVGGPGPVDRGAAPAYRRAGRPPGGAALRAAGRRRDPRRPARLDGGLGWSGTASATASWRRWCRWRPAASCCWRSTSASPGPCTWPS